MDITTSLSAFGLTTHEARVYLAVLELGQASVQDISKKSGVQRTYGYELTKKLLTRDILRTVTVGKRGFFVAVVPELLVERQKNKVLEMEQLVPELNARHNVREEKPKISFFEGLSGIEMTYQDILTHHGEIVGFSTPNYLSKDERGIIQKYIQARIARGNPARYVSEASKETLYSRVLDTKELRETRLLPKRLFHSEIELNIYGNKIACINIRSQFCVVIEDKDIASTLKQIFELVWESGKILH